MRRTFTLKLAVLLGAVLTALLLTIYRPAPQGLIPFGVGQAEVRAAPGTPAAKANSNYNLAQLRVVSATLQKISDNYVDPDRIDPRTMLLAALESVQRDVAEILVEPSGDKGEVTVQVNDKSQKFTIRDVDSPWKLASKLKEIFRFIQVNMNPGSDPSEIEYAAANGVLSTLDPHSVLLNPEQARDMDISTSGKFGGIGIEISIRNGKLTVMRLISPSTPAAQAGLKAGDHIIKINNQPTDNLTINEAMSRLRGDPHTKVVVTIERRNVAAPFERAITRDEIRVPAVYEARLLKGNIGYIRVKQFSVTTERDVKGAMTDLKRQGARAWVLDLRGNPGGLLDQAIRVSNLFVDSGTIVTTVGSGKKRKEERARGSGADLQSPVAVLVNSSSASASEIVAGALKNLGRAVIIGQTSFGKGSVQVLFDNDDGSKLKLTIAEYLTPGDVSIQSVGITPDIALVPVRVPDQLKTWKDGVRLLAASHVMREADLDAHLTSKNVREGDKPSATVKFLYTPPPGAIMPIDDDDEEEGAEAARPVQPEEPPDQFHEDFDIQFARDLLAQSGSSRRSEMLSRARGYVEKRTNDEDAKISAAIGKLGIDWSVGPKASGAALSATFTTDKPDNKVRAGEVIAVTGTVTNTGTAPAYRVHARMKSDDWTLEDTELVFGKVDPGQSRTFTTWIKQPASATSRLDEVDLEWSNVHGVAVSAPPLKLSVEGLPHPLFAYSYQLIDDGGNGDGMLSRGESVKLHVTIKNIGKGKSLHTTARLRNASGDGVVVNKGRFEIPSIGPGETKTVDFALDLAKEFGGKELVVELTVLDTKLLDSVNEKLTFPVREAAPGPEATAGVVKVKKDSPVLEGAAGDTTVIGRARKGATFKVTGREGAWTRIELESGRPGFIASTHVGNGGGSPAGGFEPAWQVMPPVVEVAVPSLEMTGEKWNLSGSAQDDNHVEDVYAIVWNRDAKIEGRKVFYRSNRGSKSPNRLDFNGNIPLWPGNNMVVVVARENNEVRSTRTVYVYRSDGTKAAAAK